ncbi:mycothiol conjugate amidase Mca [Amycolatopsis rhizosphaerae]|uniref:Mycothiol S-conjugate amidase n=1 Tax=Amycolatopsis rhizosphaerae TaxID=2053003 RepID=A0A558B1V8_9PSEU|nr:mycothiol conjugate amidase Mca [Amycolatopsis rhizosphaerae]TVT30495.1 mycothiol conjugate amidase Mca [Amycolatopsis rhizosphaerae]
MRRLMAVHAHPDDESSKGAATTARYVAEGAEVLVVTCTGGERGSVLNPSLDRPEIRADLAAIRLREMAAAREILGVQQRFLGFVDSGMDGEPPEGSFAREPLAKATGSLVEVIKEFRPQVVITYDETGGYPHPDHIKTHQVALAAFEAVAGTPWQIAKLYYFSVFTRDWFHAMHDALTARGIESAMGSVLAGLPAPTLPVTTRIRCDEYFAVRDRALLAHASQVDPATGFMAHPREVERAVWPTEDYSLARSFVPVSLVEDDLFAGVDAIADQKST